MKNTGGLAIATAHLSKSLFREMVNFSLFGSKIPDLYDKSIEELEVAYHEKWRENVALDNAIRIKLAKVKPPKQCLLLSSDIQSQLDLLAEFDHGKASQVTFAERLLRALPDGFIDSLHVEVEDHASPHCIEVSFFVNKGEAFPLANWLVYCPRWNWPGIEVILMDLGDGAPILRGSEKFFNPHSVVERTCSLVQSKLQ
jgi:hypothetical protein